MVKIVAGDLDRLVQNTLLYTNANAIRLREVLFVPMVDHFYAYSCDDHIAIKEEITWEGGPKDNKGFSLSLDEANRFGDWIKKDKKVVHKTDITLRFYNTYLKASTDDETEKFEYTEPAWDAWDLVLRMLSEDDQEEIPIPQFAVRPDRWAKMARLKADKEAPIVFRGIDINGHLLLQFKKGLSLIGVAMPIDMSYVQEEFLWQDTDQYHNLASMQTVPKTTD